MKTSVKVFHWLPRIICILAILFISLFALDSFAPGLTIWQQIGGFLIHLIPSFVLLAFLIIAWKWELAGGIIFILAGLITSPFVYTLNHNRNQFTVSQSLINTIIVTVPFIIVGILFIVSNYQKKKDLSKVQ
jgi:prolipoprotein diacylglyceryltransferase